MQADDEIRIHIEPIPDDSAKLYVFLDGARHENADPFATIMTISPKPGEPRAVIIHGALGKLSDAINVRIGRALQARGYNTAYIEVRKGNRATRRAERVGDSDSDCLDLHRIDLTQEI